MLEQQVRRMLADPRARRWSTTSPASGCTCATCAARARPDEFPDFDDNLRQAMRRETELFFDSIMREDRSVLELLTRRLHVRQRAAGAALRHPGRLRQPLPARRGHRRRARGLLGHGSILTVTSYADRTSPVVRGKWMLENLLGTPPPPPPPDVPPLRENAARRAAPAMRERMAQHRANPACAAATRVMDPLGFALENFDAVGRGAPEETGARSTRPASCRRHEVRRPGGPARRAAGAAGVFVHR